MRYATLVSGALLLAGCSLIPLIPNLLLERDNRTLPLCRELEDYPPEFAVTVDELNARLADRGGRRVQVRLTDGTRRDVRRAQIDGDSLRFEWDRRWATLPLDRVHEMVVQTSPRRRAYVSCLDEAQP